jgi:hypothetical protein
MAAPGLKPARHPSLGSAQENPGAGKKRCRFFPAQQQEIPAQQQDTPAQQQEIPAQQHACQHVTKDEYCINTENRKLQNKQIIE